MGWHERKQSYTAWPWDGLPFSFSLMCVASAHFIALRKVWNRIFPSSDLSEFRIWKNKRRGVKASSSEYQCLT